LPPARRVKAIAEIASRVRAQAQRFEREGVKLGLVVIDHLGFIKASDRYRGNRVHEVTEISAGLGQIAKEHDVALIVLSQLNRGTEGRENKRPSLSDLRDSGSLEQDADVVLFCYREAYYLERTKHDPGSQAELKRQTELEATRNTLEVIVAKNRMGPTGIVNLFCDMGCNAVRGLA
jgi:replicative DNA helicase